MGFALGNGEQKKQVKLLVTPHPHLDIHHGQTGQSLMCQVHSPPCRDSVDALHLIPVYAVEVLQSVSAENQSWSRRQAHSMCLEPILV
jgi:hypothetical protein